MSLVVDSCWRDSALLLRMLETEADEKSLRSLSLLSLLRSVSPEEEWSALAALWVEADEL